MKIQLNELRNIIREEIQRAVEPKSAKVATLLEEIKSQKLGMEEAKELAMTLLEWTHTNNDNNVWNDDIEPDTLPIIPAIMRLKWNSASPAAGSRSLIGYQLDVPDIPADPEKQTPQVIGGRFAYDGNDHIVSVPPGTSKISMYPGRDRVPIGNADEAFYWMQKKAGIQLPPMPSTDAEKYKGAIR